MIDERDEKIRAYWEDPKTGSMNDRYVATLETEMLARHIHPEDSVLDLGCGDGSGTTGYRSYVKRYVGLERSWKMLSEFHSKSPKQELARGDLRSLPFSPEAGQGFSVIVTQRALINLPDAESQEEVLQQLPGLLRPDGKLLLCEAFRDGAENINKLREHLGYDAIPARWHNVHLEKSLTKRVLSPELTLVVEEDLSTYFFLTRVVNQALNGPGPIDWDRPFNKIAFDIARSGLGPQMKGFSHISLEVWEKR